MEMDPKDRIIIALDVDSPQKALSLVKKLEEKVGVFKIGLQFINNMLRSIIAPDKESDALDNFESIRKLFRIMKGKIFWDGKLNDIPNTIAGASLEISKIGVRMFNIHASAGIEAIKQAVANKGTALVLGVTVLTSIDKEECSHIFSSTPKYVVPFFAEMLSEQGADGIICSSQELSELKEFSTLMKVVPGIRPEWASAGDQKRIMTPFEAIRAGADYLVIGRPITSPPKEIGGPEKATEMISEEITKALLKERKKR